MLNKTNYTCSQVYTKHQIITHSIVINYSPSRIDKWPWAIKIFIKGAPKGPAKTTAPIPPHGWLGCVLPTGITCQKVHKIIHSMSAQAFMCFPTRSHHASYIHLNIIKFILLFPVNPLAFPSFWLLRAFNARWDQKDLRSLSFGPHFNLQIYSISLNLSFWYFSLTYHNLLSGFDQRLLLLYSHLQVFPCYSISKVFLRSP